MYERRNQAWAPAESHNRAWSICTRKVFALLETKLDPLLVEWLRDKTALLAS